MKKIKCYVLDFGDTNFITKEKKDILNWIDSDLHELEGGEIDSLQYEITIKMLSEKQYKGLPEWS